MAGEDEEEIWVEMPEDSTTEQVLAKMEADGLRPGNHLEGLRSGARHPDLQRKHPRVALGSSCVVDWFPYVAVLLEGDAERRLRLLLRGGEWDRCSRFLAFRKKALVPTK